MADKYVRKTSLENVASETKTRAGLASSTKLTPTQIKERITALTIPTSRGTPTQVLTAASPSYTILRGKYTGGSVSVSAQGKTAVLQTSTQTISPDSGKVLSSVTVPAKNTASVAVGTITPSSGATSFSISGLSFTPVGIAIMQSYYTVNHPILLQVSLTRPG